MKPTSRLFTAAALAAVLSVPVAALAANGEEMTMFEQLDTNKDGSIDMDEASRSAQITSDFRQIDTDGDGRISRDEWQAYFSGAGGAQGGMPSPGSDTPSSTNRPAPGSASPGGY